VNWDIGAAPAGYRAPVVKFYISTDATLDTGDVLLGSISGVIGTGAVSFRMPGGLPAGTYHVIMAVDPDRLYAETNYANNTAVSGDVTVIAVPFPDLAVTAVSCNPLTTIRQGTVTLTDTVVNSGQADAGTFKVSYYLFADTDTGKMRGRTLIGERTLSSLGQGAQDNGSGPYQLPAGVYAGVYHLAAVVDLANDVVEEDESNNTYGSADMVYIRGATLSEGWDNFPYSAVYLDWQASSGAPLCNMTISVPGDADWVQFWATSGQTLSLETEEVTSGLSTVMELWTCDSRWNPVTLLAIDSGSGGGPGCSAIVHMFTKNATYLLRIYCRDPSATGAYWVTGKAVQ